MVKGFWEKMQWPIVGLAPMDGVTDAAFRYVMAKYGKPDVVFTEFTSVEGIRAGAERLLDDFYYTEGERPIVAQLFGADPEAFFMGAMVVSALGFDGIDINMGCPAKNITQKGAGASLIKDPKRAREIIYQAKAGAKAWAEGMSLKEAGVPDNIISKIEERRAEDENNRKELPISLKTRLGYTEKDPREWISALLLESPALITIHGRTYKQLYSGDADWDMIALAADLIHKTETKVLGNGDVTSVDDALSKVESYGVDGVLIGRATFGNPWVFADWRKGEKTRTPSQRERLEVALDHAVYLDEVFNGRGFVRIRKHLHDYCKGWEGARDLRVQLMKVESVEEVKDILKKYINLEDK